MPIYENANHDAKVERDLATDGGVDRSDGEIDQCDHSDVSLYSKTTYPDGYVIKIHECDDCGVIHRV